MPKRQPPAFSFSPPEWLEETDSTNDEVRRRLRRGGSAVPGMVVAARRQTGGKGRMGRRWHSDPGRDLTFSFLWCADAAPEHLGTLPMACSLGARDFLASPGLGIAAACKWPNDVLVGDDKICGILAEAPHTADGRKWLVVGMGVNVGASPGRDRAAGRPTASIAGASGIDSTPERLLPLLLPHLAARIDAWNRGGFGAIRNAFLAALWGLGQRAVARTGGGTVEGIVAGVGDAGELLLRLDEGTTVPVSSASALDSIG